MSATNNTQTLNAPPTIDVIVETDGSTSVETHGYTGASCRDASAFLERALGTATAETLTAAFHEQQRQPEQLRQHS